MSSCTDLLRLNEKSLFCELRKSLAKSAKETKNILEIRDEVLYVWHAEKCCILTLDLAVARAKNKEDVTYHTLQLTDPPIFEVSCLVINETVSQLVLWGNLGIVVVELPQRWMKEVKYQDRKNVISCISHNLDGFCSQLTTFEIRQARWHPGSTNDSHLVVLTSENIFQLYECEIGSSPKLIRTWKVGPSPSISPSKIPNFAALGDTAVDFDFATPTVNPNIELTNEDMVNKVTWNQIEWPILVLRGNGDVLIVHGNVLLGNRTKPVVFGTLSMYPPAVDNYGVDSCSIMCLQTTPPIVIIATCTGKMYHTILLHENCQDDDDKRSWSQYGSTYSLHTPEDALYVFEYVQIEMGLFYNDDDKMYSCPIHLHRDRGNMSRYFCSHNAGVHVVNLPIVSQLEKYVATDEENSSLYLPALANQSTSQYLVCTRTKHTKPEEPTPLFGFALLQEPCVLIALLHTGVVVDLSVVDYDYLRVLDQPKPITSPNKKTTKEPFDHHIKKMLVHESSQPITMLGIGSNLSAREYLELLYRATTIFRSQHFVRHENVREEINKKVRTLIMSKNHQFRELDNLLEIKKELQQTAEHLAERYEDIKDKQEELARRAEEVLRLVNLKEPSMTPMERAQAEKLMEMEDKVKELAVRLEQLKKKAANQIVQVEKTEEKTEIVLKKPQEEIVKLQLKEMGKNIADLISRAKTLSEEVDL